MFILNKLYCKEKVNLFVAVVDWCCLEVIVNSCLNVLEKFDKSKQPISDCQHRNFQQRQQQVSISPTLYARLFRTKVSCEAFLYLNLRFVLFRRKNIGAKAARNMLVKLTPGHTICHSSTSLGPSN